MLGILCGLEAEARLARKIKGAVVVNAAARPDKARALAAQLIAAGATRLLSFGLAGALAPQLPIGRLVLGTAVRTASASWSCDPAWTSELRKLFPEAACGSVWGAETIVAEASAKAALFAESGCVIADMESQCLAPVAAAQGVPFAVLRVVSDAALTTLPPAALVPLRADGRVALGSVLAALARGPRQLPALMRLGRDTGQAMRVLRQAAEHL